MKIQSFIFCHDQQTILDYINCGKFNYLPNVKYILLGSNDCSDVIHLSNVIVSRNLSTNREEWKKFVSYTGWYAIAKNDLIDDDTSYINLFEYDINLSVNFDEVLIKEIRKIPDALLYTFLPTTVPDWLLPDWTSELRKSLKSINNIDIYEYYNKSENVGFWSNSTNITLKKEVLFEFLEWFEPHFDFLTKSKFPGHEYERTISLFLHLTNKNFSCIKNVLFHLMTNSHGMTKFQDSRNYQIVKKNLLKK